LFQVTTSRVQRKLTNDAILSLGGIRNVKSSVFEILPNRGHIKKFNLKGISEFHSVDLRDQTSVKFWKFHGVGEGLKSKVTIIDDFQQNLC
jgi:hypothetical protein